MVYLTLYLAGTMHVYDQKGLSAKTWILLAPLSAAALTCTSWPLPSLCTRPDVLSLDLPTAISRSMDYRHHASDIIAGSLLGILIGWYSYRQYVWPCY